jgi:hypothetical protein
MQRPLQKVEGRGLQQETNDHQIMGDEESVHGS